MTKLLESDFVTSAVYCSKYYLRSLILFPNKIYPVNYACVIISLRIIYKGGCFPTALFMAATNRFYSLLRKTVLGFT